MLVGFQASTDRTIRADAIVLTKSAPEGVKEHSEVDLFVAAAHCYLAHRAYASQSPPITHTDNIKDLPI